MATIIDLRDKLPAYGRYVIKARAEAPGFDSSDEVSTEFVFGATIAVNGGILTFTKCLEDVSQFEILIDGVVAGTVEYDHTDDWSFDLSTLQDDTEKHTIAVRAIDEGVSEDNLSNIITGFISPDTAIYGVSGMCSSTVALTRTDDAVGLGYTINTDGTISSDFDNKFPWTRTQLVTDDYGNEFVAFPDMYFRVGVDSSRRITDIAVSGIAHDTGTWYKVPAFWYGRYGAYLNGTLLESKSGLTRTASTTRANFRTYAKNNGDGYHQLDLYHHTVMMFLWWIEWATKNSQNIMTGCISGSGTTGGTTTMPTGGTDALTTPSGYELTRRQMRYHYIEDFIGNYMEFVDGVYMGRAGTSYYDYATADPSKFGDSTTNHTKLAYPCNASYTYATIAAFGWDSRNPFLCTPTTAVNNSSYNTYFCDRIYRTTSSTAYPVPYVGAFYDNSGALCGLSYFGCNAATRSSTSVGSRLLKSS